MIVIKNTPEVDDKGGGRKNDDTISRGHTDPIDVRKPVFNAFFGRSIVLRIISIFDKKFFTIFKMLKKFQSRDPPKNRSYFWISP